MNEPSHNMDERLKAAANKRRAEQGGALEMSPVTRNMLHAEIRQKWPNAVRESPKRSWLSICAPRLAFAASLSAFVVLASVVFLKRGAEENSSMDAAVPAQTTETVGSPEGVDAQRRPEMKSEALLERREQEASETRAIDSYSKDVGGLSGGAGSAVPPSPGPEPTRTLRRAVATAPPLETESAAAAAAPKPAPVNKAPDARVFYSYGATPADQEQKKAMAAGERARFVRSQPEDLPVLKDFLLEQTENEVLVRDQDGSVYRGVKGWPMVRYSTTALGTERPVSRANTNSQPYTIQLHGTNVTLNEPVQISGVVAPLSVVTQTSVAGLADSNRGLYFRYQDQASTNGPATRFELSGAVQIGRSNQIQIRAQSTNVPVRNP